MLINKWVKAAQGVAKQSLDPSTRVGAIVCDGIDNFVAMGHNMMPPGHGQEFWDTRELKLEHVVHAEEVALLAAGQLARGQIMFVTHHPCHKCARLIAAARIRRVVCPADPWRNDDAVRRSVTMAKAILHRGGVEMVYVKGQ